MFQTNCLKTCVWWRWKEVKKIKASTKCSQTRRILKVILRNWFHFKVLGEKKMCRSEVTGEEVSVISHKHCVHLSLPELCTFRCSSVLAPSPPRCHRKRDEMESEGCMGGASVGGWSHERAESSLSRVELWPRTCARLVKFLAKMVAWRSPQTPPHTSLALLLYQDELTGH